MQTTVTSPTTTKNPTSTTTPDSNTIIRILDSLVAAVQQQSTQSDERTRTFLSYWMSPYALMCMITAVIMNRVVIFASSRNHRRLPTISNIILRVLAIYTLLRGSFGLFVALKSSSNSNFLNYFDFKLNNQTFMAMPFINPNTKTESSSPSTYILRNFHMALCLSQIMDTFISVASGCKPSMETGITLFEYSLAFQEAQFDASLTPEMITIAFIALINQIIIHSLGAIQCSQYRLIPSTIVGLFTLSFYGYNLVTLNIFKLPFTIIIGYFPHFCVLAIIILSLSVFILSGIARMSFTDLALSNVWENWNSANFTLADDFYVALINFGEFVINISTHHSYVQETPAVLLHPDNYISTAVRNYKTSGYGVEIENHPDLCTSEQRLATRSRKFMVWNRLKVLGGVCKMFLKMIRHNLSTEQTAPQKTNNAVPSKSLVNVDDVDDIDEKYAKLLTQAEFSELDNSNDYVPEEEDENEEEEDEEYDDDDDDDDDADADDSVTTRELITVDEFLPQSLMEYQIMSYHLNNKTDRPLTRSDFGKYYTDDMKLLDILIDKSRPKNTVMNKSTNSHTLTDDLGVCVICHENSRQIILWPCKCLAICEKCRISLFVREFATCVCCRSKVEGYSKVYIP